MTQKAFGIEAGMATAYVSQIETGAYKPGRAILKSISARFGVNEDWLLTGHGDPYLTLREIAPRRVYPMAIGPPGAPELADPDDSNRSDIDRHKVLSIHESEVTRYIDMARTILTSDDEIVKDALRSNLRAFTRTIENEQKIKQMEKEIAELKRCVDCSRAPAGNADGD